MIATHVFEQLLAIIYFALQLFLGAFAKLRRATISLVVSIFPSVRTEELASYWKYFRAILYLSIYRKSSEKIKVLFKSNNMNLLAPELFF